MASRILTQAHQSPARLAGTWKLAGGRAVTLQPTEAGVVRVAHGSVWATGDGPHSGAANDMGDRFLHAGDKLPLRRGQRLVMEAVDAGRSAYFSWDPAPQATAARVEADALVQPAQDLRAAVLLGADAAARLLWALARLSSNWVRERPSFADRALSAHSSA
jgi:hypothetical protein